RRSRKLFPGRRVAIFFRKSAEQGRTVMTQVEKRYGAGRGMMRGMAALTIAMSVALLAVAPAMSQQAPEEAYRLPPRAVLDILDAPPPAQAWLSPNRQWLTVVERDADETTIAELAEPMLMLAGRRFKQFP